MKRIEINLTWDRINFELNNREGLIGLRMLSEVATAASSETRFTAVDQVQLIKLTFLNCTT